MLFEGYGDTYSYEPYDTFQVVPFTPTWGPDQGRQYILFVVKFREWFKEKIYKYDIEREEFTELEMPDVIEYVGDINTSSVNWSLTGATYNSRTRKTIFARQDIQEFTNHNWWASNKQITGLVEFQGIDCEKRDVEKDFKYIQHNPAEGIGVKTYLSTNGLPPEILHTPEQNQTLINMDKMVGYQLNIKMTKLGGGKPFTSGVTIGFEMLSTSRSRSWAQSRRASVQKLMADEPIIVGGSTGILSGTILIQHGLNFKPAAVFVSIERSGSVGSLSVLEVTSWDATYIRASYTGWQSGDIVHWIAVLTPATLYDSSIDCGEMRFFRTQKVYCDVARLPSAILLSQMAMGTTKRFYTPQTDVGNECRTNFSLVAYDTILNTIIRWQSAWGVFQAGTLDTYFQAGSQSLTADTDTAINHGGSTAPSAVCVSPHGSNDSQAVLIRGVSSTQITLRSVGVTGRVDWVAVW